MDKNKLFTGIGLALFIGVLALCLFINPGDSKATLATDMTEIIRNAQNESENVKESDEKKFNEIDTDEFIELLQGNKKEIVLLGRDGCHYCEIANPILKKIAKDYNLNINYLGIDKLDDESKEKLKNSSEIFDDSWGTPLLIIVKNNKVIDKQNGLTDTLHYEEFFKNNGLIKK